MEIIGMEANAYEKSIRELNQFLDKIDRLLESTSPKAIGEWIDNQEACLILNVSLRTLQNLRDTGQIAYTQLERKVYYKREDIQKYINKHSVKR